MIEPTNRMKIGDKITIQKSITAMHMFPPPNTMPDIIEIVSGTNGTIETIYDSGIGIIRLENGKQVMMRLEV